MWDEYRIAKVPDKSDFGVNGAIDAIVTSGTLFYLYNGSFISIFFFIHFICMPLTIVAIEYMTMSYRIE